MNGPCYTLSQHWDREKAIQNDADADTEAARQADSFSFGLRHVRFNTRGNVMTIDELAEAQYKWVERMGWHNKTVLEALALIASEVGEAVNECRGEKPTPEFGSELVDIILRTVDLAQWQGIDLGAEIAAKMAINEERGTRGRRI